jgi:hypothetical protein
MFGHWMSSYEQLTTIKEYLSDYLDAFKDGVSQQ